MATKEGRAAKAARQLAENLSQEFFGGRIRTRDEDCPRGVTHPHWREFQAGCVVRLQSDVSAEDPTGKHRRDVGGGETRGKRGGFNLRAAPDLRLFDIPQDQALPDNDPRRPIQRGLTYLTNNLERVDYPRYRRLGLPVTSTLMESLVKEFKARGRVGDGFPPMSQH